MTTTLFKDNTLLCVSFFVIALHLALPFFALLHEPPVKTVKKTPLVVKTVRLQEKTTTPAAQVSVATPAIEPKAASKKAAELAIKPAVAPPKKEKAPAPAPKKESLKPKEKEASYINKAKESIEKIGKSTSAKEASPSKIALLSTLNADAFQEEHLQGETDYRDELVYTLKQNLTLPEYGKVNIALKLSSKGEVISLKIESAKSALNRGYVEREVPRLKFTPFKEAFSKHSDHLFHITLTSD